MKRLSNNRTNKTIRARCITVLLLSASIIWLPHTGRPVSLDGTTGVVYVAGSHPFADTDFATGFVRLAGGFSVPAAAGITMNVQTPVSGPINLNSIGTVTLGGDLHLASDATITSGGIINGMGFALLMHDNLSLLGSVLEIASTTIIDGQGHTLSLSGSAGDSIIFINGASGTKLILRNMTIRGLKTHGSGFPAILFGAGTNQSLVLENVTVHLEGDFLFTGGRLDIREEVNIMGPHTFDFNTASNMVIRDNATLSIGLGTTLKYRPADKSKNSIIMKTNSSCIHLMGGTIFAPSDTGLRFTKGNLFIDYRSILQGDGFALGNQGFEFGDGLSIANDVKVTIAPGAKLEVEESVLKYQNLE